MICLESEPPLWNVLKPMSLDGQDGQGILTRGGKVERKPSPFLFHTPVFISGLEWYTSKIMNQQFQYASEDVFMANR